MSNEAERAAELTQFREFLGDFAPALLGYTDKVLFGDVWKRPGLTPRERSLIVISALLAMYRPEELTAHIGIGLNQNGVTQEELAELITMLAFYAGWPNAMTASRIAKTFVDAKATKKG